jgi:hypothetical protein
MYRQAVFIQDISGFRAMVDPHLQLLVQPFLEVGVSLDAILYWVISEELWKVYQVAIVGHHPRQSFVTEIYNRLTSRLANPTLHEVTRHFIKVPRIYGDQEVSIKLKRCDLTINYYLHKPLTYPS